MELVAHSENIAELAAALSKAQGQIKGAVKDSENPHFKSSYADLASVWDACRVALASNGLAVIQIPGKENGDVVVTTLLTHSSGQWIKGQSAATPMKNDAQAFGSCTTYLRRYSLAAMVGVAPEDDDGEAASGRSATPAGKTPPAQSGQARTAAPQSNADAEWKKDAERIKKEIQNSSSAATLDKFVRSETAALEEIKKHSETAYTHLMKCANQRTAELSQVA